MGGCRATGWGSLEDYLGDVGSNWVRTHRCVPLAAVHPRDACAERPKVSFAAPSLGRHMSLQGREIQFACGENSRCSSPVAAGTGGQVSGHSRQRHLENFNVRIRSPLTFSLRKRGDGSQSDADARRRESKVSNVAVADGGLAGSELRDSKWRRPPAQSTTDSLLGKSWSGRSSIDVPCLSPVRVVLLSGRRQREKCACRLSAVVAEGSRRVRG